MLPQFRVPAPALALFLLHCGSSQPKPGAFRSAPYHLDAADRENPSRNVLAYCIGDSPESSVLPAIPHGMDAPSPQPIQLLDVFVGTGMHCALTSEHEVLCWGLRGYDTKAIAVNNPHPPPGHTPCLQNVQSVALGVAHACALLDSQTVRCWGDNSMKQLGASDALDGSGVFTPDIGHVQKLAAGNFHTCALNTDGMVYCWGSNRMNALGDTPAQEDCRGMSEKTCRATPLPVPGIQDAVDIVAGDTHTCVRTRSGLVLCWGANSRGELGNHGTKERKTPVEVIEARGAVALAAGSMHTCALLRDRTVLCWGDAGSMELGRESDRTCALQMAIGEPPPCDPWPARVPDLSEVRAIDARGLSTCALRMDGSVWCWGVVHGDEEPPYGWANSFPSAIDGVHDATALRVGYAHTCVQRGALGWYCFGREFTPPILNNGPRPASMYGSKLVVEKQP